MGILCTLLYRLLLQATELRWSMVYICRAGTGKAEIVTDICRYHIACVQVYTYHILYIAVI